MNLSAHVISSLPLALASYMFAHSLSAAAGVLIGGVLIDVDHVVEFWYDRGISFNVHSFFSYAQSGVNSRFFVIFHSIELLFLMALCVCSDYESFLFRGIVIGMALHLLLDYINITRWFGYRWYSLVIFSFLFRLLFKFDRRAIDRVARRSTA